MTFQSELVGKAQAQWDWFGKDTGRQDHFIDPQGKTTPNKGPQAHPNPRKETVEPYASRIADYWLSVPTADYNRLVRLFAASKGKLDGTIDIAWSAAFISYCMQVAGAGPSFPYAPGHATWIVKAIKNRSDNKLKAPIVGYRPGELPLALGDLIGRPRVAGVTYQNAVATGWFEAHSDIVVEIDTAKGLAFVIGGNVGQTVSKSQVTIDNAGHLTDGGGWIVHIRNNIAPPAPVVAGAMPHPSVARVG